MTVTELLARGSAVLSPRSDSPIISLALLAFTVGCQKEYFLAHGDTLVSPRDEEVFFSKLHEVYNGKPLAYVLGKKEFFGLDFFVDERVLIPRPETELLVERVLQICSSDKPFVIADVGTGSGCIAISLAKRLLKSRVYALDISPEVLKVARRNVQFHGVSDHVSLLQSDLLNKIIDQNVDIVVANLPYIGEVKFRFIEENVERFEPHEALFGGYDGFDLYKKLFQQIHMMAQKPKYLFGEFGFSQSEVFRDILNQFFVQKWEIFSDYSGIERIFKVHL